MSTKLTINLFCIGWLCLPSASADDTCRLRFLDSTTLKPIARHTFQLVPRRIELKALPNTPDPNLQFAKPFSTDADGFVSITTTSLVDLTNATKNYVDSVSDSYSRFCISGEHRPPAPMTFSLTTFHAVSGVVAARHLLSSTELTIVTLDAKQPK
jgi:hypothetical protein